MQRVALGGIEEWLLQFSKSTDCYYGPGQNYLPLIPFHISGATYIIIVTGLNHAQLLRNIPPHIGLSSGNSVLTGVIKGWAVMKLHKQDLHRGIQRFFMQIFLLQPVLPVFSPVPDFACNIHLLRQSFWASLCWCLVQRTKKKGRSVRCSFCSTGREAENNSGAQFTNNMLQLSTSSINMPTTVFDLLCLQMTNVSSSISWNGWKLQFNPAGFHPSFFCRSERVMYSTHHTISCLADILHNQSYWLIWSLSHTLNFTLASNSIN